MSKPVLYLMLGYPGAGKTTVAKIICELTGAAHLWADQERRERFGEPTYSPQENQQLYEYMNTLATDLLEGGRSVVFDTGFNYYKDRQALRDIADTVGADCRLIWVTVDTAIARERATKDAQLQSTRPHGDMSAAEFEHLVSRLEEPVEGEDYIKLDGTKITPEYVADRLHF